MKDGRVKTPEPVTELQGTKPEAKASGTGAGMGSEAQPQRVEPQKPWEKMPREVWELLGELRDEEETFVKMSLAVMEYLFEGRPTPESSGFKGATRVVYMSMCQSIDRYKAVTEIRAKAGRRGGQKRRKKAKDDLLNDDKAKTVLLEKEEAKEENASRVKSEECRVKSVDISDNSNYPLTTTITTTKKGGDENNENLEITAEDKKKYAKCCILRWNELVDLYPNTKLKKVLRVTESRIEKLHVLRGQYEAKHIEHAFRNCMQNDYCNGRGNNERRKPVDFDWIITEDVFVKAYENTI